MSKICITFALEFEIMQVMATKTRKFTTLEVIKNGEEIFHKLRWGYGIVVCPYCGSMGWVSCGGCKKLTCWGSGDRYFTCEWCGNSGEVRESDTFDLQGGGY